MRTFLLTVEDVFCITGRGCAVTAGMPDGRFVLKIGAGVVLKRPDGSEVETTVRGVHLGNQGSGAPISILLADVTKADVPIGTELWLT